MTGSICDVLPAAAALLGVPGGTDTLALAEAVGADRAERVLVVLVDGMGWHLLPELAASAPLLSSALAGAAGRLTRLACTFPSTTPTSLVSLGTGARPGEHGILGFTLNVPGTDRVVNHIHWRNDPPPAAWQPLPTWFARLERAGVAAHAVLPAAFLDGGLTDAAYRGARFVPTRPDDDYAAAVAATLRSAPGLVYGYTADLDTAAHVFGIGSPGWHEAATRVDALLTRLVEAMPADAVLLVTADHGGLNIAPDARVDLDADPRLAAGCGWSPASRGCGTCTPSRARPPMCGRPGPRSWVTAPTYTAAQRPWPRACSGRSIHATRRGSVTLWSSAPATWPSWRPPTSPRRRLGSSVSTARPHPPRRPSPSSSAAADAAAALSPRCPARPGRRVEARTRPRHAALREHTPDFDRSHRSARPPPPLQSESL